MKRLTPVILSVGLFASLAPAQNASDFESNYALLGDRNMFMRERHRPQPANTRRPDRNREDTSPQGLERAFVLRGVAIEDDTLHAYVENTRSGEVVRVAPGDTLAGGRVREIAIDALDYEADGRTAWVEVGQNLSGVRAGPTTTPTTQSADTGAAATALPPGGGTLEERMKQRRLQQRGGR